MKKEFWISELASVCYSYLAGAAIAIGGTLFLAIDSKVVGALFFTLGLFMVCTKGLHLFTGKVGFLFDQKPTYLISLVVIWLGNFAGAASVGYALRASRFAAAYSQKAAAMCTTKLNDDVFSIFILALFCGVLMFVAVEGFKNNEHILGKYLGLFLGVAGFILAGFEHCVANMFYFSIADMWSPKAFGYLLVMTLGNAVGSFILPLAKRLYVALNKPKEVKPDEVKPNEAEK